ncbi:hypothetical protein [Maricaulis salignorans]|uniref:hypothetical protein n=1 Tax=Maricaulis salignorans TaxID=144026 RepID=UPI003A934015
MIRFLAWIWTLLSVLLAIGFGWLFVTVYWNNRACFDESGRCFLDGVVYHDTSFLYFWIVLLAAVSALAGVVIAMRARRSAS